VYLRIFLRATTCVNNKPFQKLEGMILDKPKNTLFILEGYYFPQSPKNKFWALGLGSWSCSMNTYIKL
jgi:hypothetical protein